MADTRLNQQQQAVSQQISQYGQQHGYSNDQIKTAVKSAFIESSLGMKMKNADSTASGLFGYNDGTWTGKKGSGNKASNADQIKTFYNDMDRYTKKYNELTPDQKKQINQDEYIYTLHHDGPYTKDITPEAAGRKTWNNTDFNYTAPTATPIQNQPNENSGGNDGKTGENNNSPPPGTTPGESLSIYAADITGQPTHFGAMNVALNEGNTLFLPKPPEGANDNAAFSALPEIKPPQVEAALMDATAAPPGTGSTENLTDYATDITGLPTQFGAMNVALNQTPTPGVDGPVLGGLGDLSQDVA